MGGHLGPGAGAIGEGKAGLIGQFSPFLLLTLDKKNMLQSSLWHKTIHIYLIGNDGGVCFWTEKTPNCETVKMFVCIYYCSC